MAGKTAIVTGGTRGIGLAITKQLSQQGIKTYALYKHTQEATKHLADDLVIPVQVDITNYQQVDNFLLGMKEPIDILVNNAGITRDGRLENLDMDAFQTVFNTNFFGPVYLTKQVLPTMQSAGFGRIIFISSINAARGQFGQTNYASSKAAIESFAKSLAYEVAKKGITVNTVAPGYTETDMTNCLPEKIKEKVVEQIPCGRMGRPEEIADMVLYLSREESSWINGATYHVNGGQFIA